MRNTLMKIFKKTDSEITENYNERIETTLIERIRNETPLIDTDISITLNTLIQVVNEDEKEEFKTKYIDYRVKIYLENIKYKKCIFSADKFSKYREIINIFKRFYSYK